VPAPLVTRYHPAVVPVQPQLLPRFLDRELRRISDTLESQDTRTPSTVLLGQSTVTQAPTGVGAAGAIQITYGPAQGDAQSPVVLGADGTLTFQVDGFYSLDTRYVLQRSTQPGYARLFLRGLVNGVQSGNPVAVVMDEATITSYEQFTIAGFLPAGTTVRWELARDASGVNDGYLQAFASTLGWGTSPSALVRIIKF
jgi:hypothetical protein